MRPESWLGGLLLGALLTARTLAAPALPLPDLDAQTRLPINLEAASSQFDGRNNQISFEDVRITQGPLAVRADNGSAARLDFENSRWRFTGAVVLDNQGARIECDDAELLFQGHELRSAVFRGTPVRFRQERPAAAPTEGRAGVIEYDVASASLRLSQQAWVSDGANEVSGESMAYDLARRYVTADAGDEGGAVRMKIRPPAEDGGTTAP
jgi:lipopolysaccharide transport protein LptA